MTPGDVMYSFFTLLMIILFVAGPLIKKVAGKKRGSQTDKIKSEAVDSEQLFNESVDSHRVVQKMLQGKQAVKISHTGSRPFKTAGILKLDIPNEKNEKKESVKSRFNELSPLKQGILWNEVLSKPVGLREHDRDFFR